MLKVDTDQFWQVYLETGQNAAETARRLGLDASNAAARARRLKARKALRGEVPEMHINSKLPDFLKLSGTSQLFREGQEAPVLSWVKTNTDNAKLLEMMQAAVEAMGEDIPRVSLMQAPPLGNADLLNCFVITDYHMGMLSWREESGADWDLRKAEDLVVRWFSQAIQQAPDAEIGVFAQLSDFLHFDGLDAVTPASKHLLDVDTRFAKVVRAAICVLRQIIDMLLSKHQKVHVIMADANHDPVSQIWLREWFSVLYEDEPRLTVDRSPDPYYCYEFGQTALYFHHGHRRKPTNVSDVFVAKFRDVFGRTKYSYAHMGHLHHVDIKENNLMIVEQHRTLAAADAYASRGGWISGRDAKVITYHRQYGEVGRLTISPDMLKGAA